MSFFCKTGGDCREVLRILFKSHPIGEIDERDFCMDSGADEARGSRYAVWVNIEYTLFYALLNKDFKLLVWVVIEVLIFHNRQRSGWL